MELLALVRPEPQVSPLEAVLVLPLPELVEPPPLPEQALVLLPRSPRHQSRPRPSESARSALR
jgi:hypothetical protein